MKRDEHGALLIIVVVCLLAALFAAMAGCSSTEHIRLDKSPGDTAEESGCPPLPLCEIPPAANSTQLELALWSCVLEYRALYSACYHLVHQAVLGPTAYNVGVCSTENPPTCSVTVAPPVWSPTNDPE